MGYLVFFLKCKCCQLTGREQFTRHWQRHSPELYCVIHYYFIIVINALWDVNRNALGNTIEVIFAIYVQVFN